MSKRIGAAVAALTAGATIGMAGPAAAQPVQVGLVNVSIGDVTILEDVGVGVAANVAANICGVQVNAAVIADQVVRNNAPFGVCTIEEQGAEAPVTINP